jgi:hypothetical protein
MSAEYGDVICCANCQTLVSKPQRSHRKAQQLLRQIHRRRPNLAGRTNRAARAGGMVGKARRGLLALFTPDWAIDKTPPAQSRDGAGFELIGGAESKPARELRIGWLVEPGFGPIAPDVAATVAAAAKAFADFGFQVELVRIPALEENNCLHLYRLAHPCYARPQPGGLHRGFPGGRASAERFAAYFQQYDALLCPVTPVSAPPHDLSEWVIRGETVTSRHSARHCSVQPDRASCPLDAVWHEQRWPAGRGPDRLAVACRANGAASRGAPGIGEQRGGAPPGPTPWLRISASIRWTCAQDKSHAPCHARSAGWGLSSFTAQKLGVRNKRSRTASRWANVERRTGTTRVRMILAMLPLAVASVKTRSVVSTRRWAKESRTRQKSHTLSHTGLVGGS